MDRFQKSLIVAALQNTIDQLIILSKGKYKPTKPEVKNKVEKRFQNRIHESVYTKLDPFQLPIDILNQIKLQKELNCAITVFSKIVEEIIESGTHEYLLSVINQYAKEKEDEENLMKEYYQTKDELQNVKLSFKKKIEAAEIKMAVFDENIERIKNELTNVQQINEIEMSLVTKWEQTRFDQAAILQKMNEKSAIMEKKLYNIKKEEEKRAILNLENHINHLIDVYKRKILYWEDKYHTEMGDLSVDVKNINKLIIQVGKKYGKHVDIYKERQEFIDEYRIQKAEEQKRLQFQQKRIDSAIKLQAWWRGTMVRRCLGPYKKKKKGKKGKKAK